jgi:hypothetical protein
MKFIFFFALIFCASLTFGQQSNKPELSITLNTVDPFLPLGNIHSEDKYLDGGNYTNKSFAVGLTGKYFFNETTAFRLRFIYTDRNIKDYRAHSPDEKFRQTLLKFSPGFQWTFSEDKISFFGGVELPITIIGKMTRSEYVLFESLDGLTKNEYRTVYDIPGGYSAGLGIFLGSNYFFTDHLAIGLDFGTAYQYSSVGGTLSYTSTATGTSGNSTNTHQHEETIKQFKFSVIQAGINLTVKF